MSCENTCSSHKCQYVKAAERNVCLSDMTPTTFVSDEVAEWLRRWTANPMCSARVGSNPILVEMFFCFFFYRRLKFFFVLFFSSSKKHLHIEAFFPRPGYFSLRSAEAFV